MFARNWIHSNKIYIAHLYYAVYNVSVKLNRNKFYHALEHSSAKSVCNLARQSNLHRNTINHYLANGSVYQHGFLALCDALHVQPEDLVDSQHSSGLLNPEVARIVDELHARFPHVTFVLMGSRARGRQKKYSDWDIGFFSYSTPMTHQTHLDLLKRVDDLLETSTEEIDLVNLNEASQNFLEINKYNFVFLTGRLSDWHQFQENIYGHEKRTA